MTQRLWRAYVRAGELRQRLMRAFNPTRMQFVAHSWPLRPDVCPCDVDFCDYVDSHGMRGRSVFHFGTGGHHLVGLRNHAEGWTNEVLGLTVSPREHDTYVRHVVRDPALAKHYKVLFADIYSLSTAALPTFDVVTLFHLCEFADPSSAGRRLDDSGLLRMFCCRLAPEGLLLLYKGSFGYSRAQPLLAAAVAEGTLAFVEEFRSLAIYRRTGATRAAAG
jgi:hypothetical protein